MKAVVYKKPLSIDSVDSLINLNIPTPEVRDYDVLVEVKAISVNPVDVKIRRNVKPENLEYKVLGWDASGVVRARGKFVSTFEIGDEVYYSGDLNRSGSYSEFQSVDSRIVARKPRKLTFSEAAAIPLTALTAWEGLFERLKVSQKDQSSILITGAAGGVGSMVIQLLKAQTSLKIIATASRKESEEWVLGLGADYVINHYEDMPQQILDKKLDSPKYIFSTADTEKYLSQYNTLIRPQGSIILIDDPVSLDIVSLKRKSITVAWELMFTRSMYHTDDLYQQGEILKKVASLIDEGAIKSTKSKVFHGIDADNLKKAHNILESNRSIGKVVLEGWG